jgi:metallo-beta-lactamase class B
MEHLADFPSPVTGLTPKPKATVSSVAARCGAAGTLALAVIASLADAATPAPTRQQMADWNLAQAPFQIFGNTWHVGTRSLAAILVTSDYGHVLINAGMQDSAKQIAANITKLGFKPTDVKAILLTHAHFDTAGGLAELQQLTGAAIHTRRPNDIVLRTGKLMTDDPQHTLKTPRIASPAGTVWVVSDNQLLGVGSNRFQSHPTPGHSPGGTTWTWESCEAATCLKMAYVDSMSLVAGKGYRFSGDVVSLARFRDSLQRIAALPCDVLITPRNEDSRLLERVAARDSANRASLKDSDGCKRFADAAAQGLEQTVAAGG